jgi:hypothetical protein
LDVENTLLEKKPMKLLRLWLRRRYRRRLREQAQTGLDAARYPGVLKRCPHEKLHRAERAALFRGFKLGERKMHGITQ